MSVGVLSAQGACLEENRLAANVINEPEPAHPDPVLPYPAPPAVRRIRLSPSRILRSRRSCLPRPRTTDTLDSLAIPAIVRMKVLKAGACNHDYDRRHQKQATDCGFPGCPPAGRFQERTGNRN